MNKHAIKQEKRQLSDFEEKISGFVEHAIKSRKALILTEAGESKAVLLDIDNYRALIEELKLLKDIRVAEKQIRDGDYLTDEEAKQRLLD